MGFFDRKQCKPTQIHLGLNWPGPRTKQIYHPWYNIFSKSFFIGAKTLKKIRTSWMLKIVPHFDYELQKGCAFCLMYDCKLQHENKIMLQCGECFSIELGHYTGLVNRLLGLSDFSCSIVQYFIVRKKQFYI